MKIADPRYSTPSAQVLQHYVSNPHLIERLLINLGAQDVVDVGGEFRCTCPIHRGNNRQNFVVWYDHDAPVWRCFSHGCGTGPLQTLVMARMGLSEDQALAHMAQSAGLVIAGGPPVSRDALEAAELAACEARMRGRVQQEPLVFNEAMVAESMAGGTAYFESRGFSAALLRRFEVGFVPANRWVAFDPKWGKSNGWFEDRVSIPIRMQDARLIGFSGRRVDGLDFQKYKQLPGTRKGLALYPLHIPRIQREIQQSGMVYIVEGFADVWRCVQHGIFNVLSVMGTDISAPQLGILGSLCLGKIVFAYDGDDPGQAAMRSHAESVCQIAPVFRVGLPTGSDPGDIRDRTQLTSLFQSFQPLPSTPRRRR